MHRLKVFFRAQQRSLRRLFLSTPEKKLTVLGVGGVIIAFVFGMGIFAAGIPWSGTADSPQNLDYAWQIGHGQIPSFFEGTQAPLNGYKSKIQFVSHHPPLYYALLAPIVTPLLDTGHWASAVAVARGINILIGVLCILAFAWGGWVIGGKRRALFAIATPALGTALLTFNVAGDIMNDALLTLFATLALVLSVRILQHGLTRQYVAALAAVCLGGMATKSSFVSALLIVFLAVVIAAQLHGRGSRFKRFIVASGVCVIFVAVIAVGIGWFYVHNYQLSGSPFRSRPRGSASQALNLKYKTLPEVLQSRATWDMVTVKFYGRDWKLMPKVRGWPINYWASVLVLVFVSLGVGLQLWRSKKSTSAITWIAAGLLLLQFVLVYGQQISYAVGYGGLNRRYLLPAWLSFSLFLAVGALYFRKLRGIPVIVMATLGWLSYYAVVINFLVVRGGVAEASYWQVLSFGIVQKNGFPAAVLPILVCALIAGLAIEGYALWKLSATTQHSKQRRKSLDN